MIKTWLYISLLSLPLWSLVNTPYRTILCNSWTDRRNFRSSIKSWEKIIKLTDILCPLWLHVPPLFLMTSVQSKQAQVWHCISKTVPAHQPSSNTEVTWHVYIVSVTAIDKRLKATYVIENALSVNYTRFPGFTRPILDTGIHWPETDTTV
jgi:hypothetical protein